MSMPAHRSVLVAMLSLGLATATLPASALGLSGPHGQGTWLGASQVHAGVGGHLGDYRHPHARHGHRHHDRHRHGHHRGSGRRPWTLHTMGHRHGGLGWHVHRGWWHHRHPHHGWHRSRRHDDWDDWEEGAGIALGVLAGMLLLDGLAGGGSGSAGNGDKNTHSPVLDAHSRQRQGQAIRNALDAGGNGVALWENPANRGGRAGGEVRITRNGRDDFGNVCREYHQRIRIGNRIEQGHRVACRDRQGSWHLR